MLDDGEAATCERNAAAIRAAYLFAPDRLDIIAPGLLRDPRACAREFSPLHCCEEIPRVGDLKPFIRDLMRQMEHDLATRLDWVVGRIVAEGVADELRDRRYLIVDSIDGRAHYVDLGVHADADALSPGMIVEVRARSGAARAVDRTIAAVAAEHEGIYRRTAHRARDRTASDEHIAAHVRRLEALRRRGLVERTPEGDWKVGHDYVDRAASYEAHQRSRTPVGLAVLSWRPLDQLPGAEGATWLDRQLTSSSPETVRTAGFGAEVEAALNRRRQWLLDQGFARDVDGKVAELGAVLGRDDEAELVAVAGAAFDERLALDLIGRRVIEAARLALPGDAVALDVAQMRPCGAEITALEPDHPGLDDDPSPPNSALAKRRDAEAGVSGELGMVNQIGLIRGGNRWAHSVTLTFDRAPWPPETLFFGKAPAPSFPCPAVATHRLNTGATEVTWTVPQPVTLRTAREYGTRFLRAAGPDDSLVVDAGWVFWLRAWTPRRGGVART